jgi:hypothetical protein
MNYSTFDRYPNEYHNPTHPNNLQQIKTMQNPAQPSDKEIALWKLFDGRNHHHLAAASGILLDDAYDIIHRVRAWSRDHETKEHPSSSPNIKLGATGIGSAMAAQLAQIRMIQPSELAIALSVLDSLPQLTHNDLTPIINGLHRDLSGKTLYISRERFAPPSAAPAQACDTGSPPNQPVAPAQPPESQSHSPNGYPHLQQMQPPV